MTSTSAHTSLQLAKSHPSDPQDVVPQSHPNRESIIYENYWRSAPVDEELMNEPVDTLNNYSPKPKNANDSNNSFKERESLPLPVLEENLEPSLEQVETAFAVTVRNNDISGYAKSHENIEESSLSVDAAPNSVGFPNLTNITVFTDQPIPEIVDDQNLIKGSQEAAPDESNNNEGIQNLDQDDSDGCCSGWKVVFFYVFSYLRKALVK